jgi:hypothetical protein
MLSALPSPGEPVLEATTEAGLGVWLDGSDKDEQVGLGRDPVDVHRCATPCLAQVGKGRPIMAVEASASNAGGDGSARSLHHLSRAHDLVRADGEQTGDVLWRGPSVDQDVHRHRGQPVNRRGTTEIIHHQGNARFESHEVTERASANGLLQAPADGGAEAGERHRATDVSKRDNLPSWRYLERYAISTAPG